MLFLVFLNTIVVYRNPIWVAVFFLLLFILSIMFSEWDFNKYLFIYLYSCRYCFKLILSI